MPAKGNPIPKGYPRVSPTLVVREAARAIEFYKQVFGAAERFRMPGPEGKIMHAEIQIGDSVIMICDEFPEMPCVSPLTLNGTPVSLYVYMEDADQTFDSAIKAGAKAMMPPTDMFWGDRFCKIQDPFGHEWSIATHQWDLTAEEVQKAAAEAGCGS